MKSKPKERSDPCLKMIPLGGMGDVTKNIYVYECSGEIIVVDCGIGFPEGDLLGVDIVIPDVAYLKENAKKIKAFLITHGHNDHFSALPYVLPQINASFPIYSTRLVAGFIKNQLNEFGLKNSVQVREFDPHGSPLRLGVFNITPFRINHSVPDSVGFVIDTPQGRVVHVSDFKFDWTPVDGKIFDVARLLKASSGGVDLLLSDCLGSHKLGYTSSEYEIEHSFDDLFDLAQKQIFITTTSSNVSRIQQAINSSIRHGRKVVLLGKSVRDNVTIANELGYMKIPKGVILDSRKVGRIPPHKVTYIVAGSYGQKGSAMHRIAENESRYAKVSEGDMIIFSGDPSPSGVKDAVDRVVDKLTTLGADVHHYEIQENLHVSGHGSQGDMLMLARLTNPKYFVPIGGTASTMRGYTKLMEKAGFKAQSVFELVNGETLEIRRGNASRGQKIKVADIFVDGLGVGDVGRRVLDERAILSQSGVLIIAAAIGRENNKLVGTVEVSSRGFIFEKNSTALLKEIRERALKILSPQLGQIPLHQVKEHLEEDLSKFLFKETEREPLILSVFTSI